MNKPTFVYTIYIDSTPEKVWAALTDPNLTAEYWSHRNVSDWKVGSKWEHQRVNDPAKVDVLGKIIESDPQKRLVLTWNHLPHPDVAPGASRVTFEIAKEFDTARLTVTHEELPDSAMLESISKGWPAVLSNLKTLLETGRSFDMIRKWMDAYEKKK